MNCGRTIIGIAAILVTAAGLALGAAESASADPHGAGAGQLVTLNCDNLGTLLVVGEGNGLWTRTAQPMHVINSNLVLLVYAVHFEVTEPGEDTTVIDASKPAPQNGRLDVCHQSETSAEGTFNATYWVSYTPA